MRIRARLKNPAMLERLAHSLDKFGPYPCIIKLAPDVWQCIMVSNRTGGMQLWSRIQTSIFLEDCRIESDYGNIVYLEVFADELHRVLKSTKGALGCTIKLIRHEDKPALLFSITHRSRANILQTIKQQIPAQVIAPGSGDDISEPNLPSPHVFIMAPSLPILRAHVEKLRTLDKFVYVGANMRGRFSLRYQNNELEVQTEWTGLLHPEPAFEIARSASNDPTRLIEAKISVKELISFLHCHYVEPTDIVCTIIEGCAVMFYVSVGVAGREPITLTYYIPSRQP